MLKLKPTQPKIILLALLFFAILSIVIILKLVSLQIVDSNHLEERAAKNRQHSRNVKFRGNIKDRNGVTLASDITVYDIYAHPRYYKKSPYELSKILAKYLKHSEDDLLKKLGQIENLTIAVEKDIEIAQAEKIMALKLRGLDIVRKTKRIYPQGEFASHILGYVNKNAGILAGVEKAAKKPLENTPIPQAIEYDGKGNVIYNSKTDPAMLANPLKGLDIALTLDSKIQHIVEKELKRAILKTGALRGTIIVLDPRNGDILGFSVYPSYNPNEYGKAKLEQHKNWAISDVFPPGSTMKALTIASALELGVITPKTKILDSGKMEVGNWTIKNHDYKKNKNPGLIDLKTLFKNSSNVGAAKIGMMMDKNDHRYMLQKFGLGAKTGIELPGESAGLLPKKWNKTRHATISFGHGISTTALQMVSAFATVANGGVWINPHILANRNTSKNRVVSTQTAHVITRLLAQSVEDSEIFKKTNLKVAGKSGTSQKPNPNGKGFLKGQVVTSFIGYFPVENPKIVISVVLDNPTKLKEAWGSTVSAPVFEKVANEIMRVGEL